MTRIALVSVSAAMTLAGICFAAMVASGHPAEPNLLSQGLTFLGEAGSAMAFVVALFTGFAATIRREPVQGAANWDRPMRQTVSCSVSGIWLFNTAVWVMLVVVFGGYILFFPAEQTAYTRLTLSANWPVIALLFAFNIATLISALRDRD